MTVQGELDVASLRKSLAALNRQVQHAQARLVETIEAKRGEFVRASDHVQELQETIAKIRKDVQITSEAWSAEAADPASGSRSAASQIQKAAADHAAISREIETVQAASQILAVLLSAQQQLSSLASLVGRAKYVEAAELTLKIASGLQGISAADSNTEPLLVKAVKMQYYQHRAVLITRLEEAMSALVVFEKSGSVVVRQHIYLEDDRSGSSGASLKEVWQALSVLELRSRRVDQLAETMRSEVLKPMFASFRHVDPNCRVEIEARLVTSNADGGTTFMWSKKEVKKPVPGNNDINDSFDFDMDFEGDDKDAEGSPDAAARPPIAAVLPAVEALFQFVHDHCVVDLPEVKTPFGRKLWEFVARKLLFNFECSSENAIADLLQFEVKMRQLGLIKECDRDMWKNAEDKKAAALYERHLEALDELRNILLQDISTLVPVADETEPGCITEAHREMLLKGQKFKEIPPHLARQMSQSIRQDPNSFKLPEMKVSPGAKKLVELLRRVGAEVVQACAAGEQKVAGVASQTARYLLDLFIMLRPFVADMRMNPRLAGIFHTDILYVAHMTDLMPYNFGATLSQKEVEYVLFLDSKQKMVELEEQHFVPMVLGQREEIQFAMKTLELGPGISRDGPYGTAEAALHTASQKVNFALQGLAVALPECEMLRLAPIIVGAMLHELKKKLFAMRRISSNDVPSVVALLKTALNMVRQAYAGIKLPAGRATMSAVQLEAFFAREIQLWWLLTMATDLLGEDFSSFLQKRRKITKVLKREEAIKLMYLSWEDLSLAPEDAWKILSGE